MADRCANCGSERHPAGECIGAEPPCSVCGRATGGCCAVMDRSAIQSGLASIEVAAASWPDWKRNAAGAEPGLAIPKPNCETCGGKNSSVCSDAAHAPDLSPPWVLFLERGRPVVILPAGRPGEVANVSGLTLEQARAIVDAANQTNGPLRGIYERLGRLVDSLERSHGEGLP